MQPINFSSASQNRLVFTLAGFVHTRGSLNTKDELLLAAIYTAAICDPAKADLSIPDKIDEEYLLDSVSRWTKGHTERVAFLEKCMANTPTPSPEMSQLIAESVALVQDHGYLPTLVAFVQLVFNASDGPMGIYLQPDKDQIHFPHALIDSAFHLLGLRSGDQLNVWSESFSLLPPVIAGLVKNLRLDLFTAPDDNDLLWSFLSLVLTNSAENISWGAEEALGEDLISSLLQGEKPGDVAIDEGLEIPIYFCNWIDSGKHFLCLPPLKDRSQKNRRSYFHTYELQIAMSRMSPGQSFCFFLPQSFLSSSDPAETSLRKRLVTGKFLKTVVQLPPLSIGRAKLSMCILILRKDHDDSPVFVDATECLSSEEQSREPIFDKSKFLSLLTEGKRTEKIGKFSLRTWRAENYSLNVGIYLPLPTTPHPKDSKLVPLGSLVSVASTRRAQSVHQRPVITAKDLDGLDTLTSSSLTENTSNDHSFSERQRPSQSKVLEKSALVISEVFHKRLKAAYFEVSDPIDLQPNLIALEIKSEQLLPEWLLHTLDTDWAREHFRRRVVSSTIPRIRRQDLFTLPVPLPSLSDQQEQINRIKRERIDLLAGTMGLQSELEEARKHEQLYLRARAHTMAQQFSGLKSGLSVLKKILARDGKLEANATPIEGESTTVSERIDSVYSSCLELGKAIKQLSRPTLSNPSRDFVLEDEVKSWVARQTHQKIKLLYSLPMERLVEDPDDPQSLPVTGSSPEDLDTILKNLVENACRHGFADDAIVDPKIELSILYDSTEDEGPFVILRVANNGTPLPDSFTINHFAAPQLATGVTGNQGLGGWIVQELVSEAGAKLIIVDPTSLDEGFTTAFEIKFYLL